MKTPWYLKHWLIYSVVSLFSFSLIAPPLAAAQKQAATKKQLTALKQYRAEREDLATMLYQVKKQRVKIDETDFSPAAKAQVIGPNIDDLFAFVRDEIAYHPYPGILRLAEGTLMSRAGNACDQSLLLGNLLRTHGYTVRYAHGQLSEAQTRDLLAHTDQPSPLTTRPNQEERFGHFQGIPAEQTIGVQSLMKEGLKEFQSALSSNVTSDVALLTQYLEGAGLSLTSMGGYSGETLLSEIQAHCWVQVESNGEWKDLDPSFPNQNPGQRVTEVSRVTDSFGTAEFAYKLKFVMSIEQTKNGKSVNKVVLDQTASLTETFNYIRVVTMPETPGASATQALSDADFLKSFDVMWPMVHVNGHVLTGDPFNLEGDIVPTDPRVRQAQKVQKAVGGGFGALGGALSGLMGESDKSQKSVPPQLTRVWLTLTLIHPDGKEKSLERQMVERLQGKAIKAEIAERDLRRQLLSDFTIMASGSRVANPYVATRYLDHQLANRRGYFAALALEHGQPVSNIHELMDKRIQSYPFQLLEFFYARAAEMEAHVAKQFPGLSAFAAEPQVVAFRQSVKFLPEKDPIFQQRLDIMFNAIRAVDPSSNNPSTNRVATFQFQQGVLDTNIEYFMMGGGESVNTHSVLARAIEEGVQLSLISPSDSAALAKIAIDDNTRAALTRDLEQGFVVLAPINPILLKGAPAFAWWRVHPDRGETLGMAGDGEGQAISEYLYSALTSAMASSVLCGLFQIPSAYQTGSIDKGAYAKCVIVGAVSGGMAPAFGGGLGGMTLFNLVACQFSLALNQMDMHLGGARGHGIDPVNERSHSPGSQLAKDFALCFIIGMAASGASYGIRKAGANRGYWPQPGKAGVPPSGGRSGGRTGPTTPGPRTGPTTPGPRTGPTTPGPRTGPTTPGPRTGPTTPGPRTGPTTPGSQTGPTRPGPRTGPTTPGSQTGPTRPGPRTTPTTPGSQTGPTTSGPRPGMPSTPGMPGPRPGMPSTPGMPGPRPGMPSTPGSQIGPTTPGPRTSPTTPSAPGSSYNPPTGTPQVPQAPTRPTPGPGYNPPTGTPQVPQAPTRPTPGPGYNPPTGTPQVPQAPTRSVTPPS